MTMEQSILKTAAVYNKVVGFGASNRIFSKFVGKIDMYGDVMERQVTYNTDKDGRITSVSFGEDVMEVKS